MPDSGLPRSDRDRITPGVEVLNPARAAPIPLENMPAILGPRESALIPSRLFSELPRRMTCDFPKYEDSHEHRMYCGPGTSPERQPGDYVFYAESATHELSLIHI